MQERPILFSAPMVRAILAGSKVQTRRAIKVQPPEWALFTQPLDPGAFEWNDRDVDADDLRHWPSYDKPLVCPYGKPGDRLWVRETFGISYDGSAIPWTGADPQRDGKVIYQATFDEKPEEGRLPWKPSIHMPRLASRILLEITEVRVERLQDISEGDALAEGVERDEDGWKLYSNPKWLGKVIKCAAARASFESLWTCINGPGSWDANPWVWVISFKRLTPLSP